MHDFIMSKADTQKIMWDRGSRFAKLGFKQAMTKLRKSGNNVGIYGVFNWSLTRSDVCLYIGASKKLRQRVSRFYIPSMRKRAGNVYLQAIVDRLWEKSPENPHIVVQTKLIPKEEHHLLDYYEIKFMEKYNPMTNISTLRTQFKGKSLSRYNKWEY